MEFYAAVSPHECVKVNACELFRFTFKFALFEDIAFKSPAKLTLFQQYLYILIMLRADAFHFLRAVVIFAEKQDGIRSEIIKKGRRLFICRRKIFVDLIDKCGRTVEKHLHSGRYSYPFERVGSPLGFNIESGNGVDGISPEFKADRERLRNGENIRDGTPDGELTCTLDLVRA